MKQLILLLIISTGSLLSGFGQQSDSLILNQLQKNQRQMRYLNHQIKTLQRKNKTLTDSALKQQKVIFNQLKEFNKSTTKNFIATIDSLEGVSNSLANKLDRNAHNEKNRFRYHFLLHGIAIILILMLFLLFVRARRRSIDRLISEAKKMEAQNEEMQDTANQMEKMNNSLKKMVKEQKKLKKRLKKK